MTDAALENLKLDLRQWQAGRSNAKRGRLPLVIKEQAIFCSQLHGHQIVTQATGIKESTLMAWQRQAEKPKINSVEKSVEESIEESTTTQFIDISHLKNHKINSQKKQPSEFAIPISSKIELKISLGHSVEAMVSSEQIEPIAHLLCQIIQEARSCCI